VRVATVASISGRARVAVVLIGAALIPIVFTTRFNDVFATSKFVVLSIVVGLGLALSIIEGAVARPPRPSVLPLVVAFVGWETIATMWSRAPAVSLLGLYGRYDGLATLVLLVLFAGLVVAVCWDHPVRVDALAWALVVGAVVAAVYVWLQQLDLDWVRWYVARGRPVPRPQGALGNSNFSGAHLAMSIPLVVGLAAKEAGWRRTLLLSVLPVIVGAVWFTGSRGAIVAALVGSGIAGLLAPGSMPRRAAIALCVVGTAGVAASLFVISFGASGIPGPLSDLDVLRTGSLDVRRELWPAAFRAVADRPLIGTGPDTFVMTFLEHRSPAGAGFPESLAAEPHNIFLDHAVSAGIVGAGLFIAIMVKLLRDAVAAPRHALLGGFTGMLCAYLVQGMFSVDTVGLTFLGWTAMAAMVVLSDPRILTARTADPSPSDSGRRSVSSLTMAGVLLVLVGWLVIAVRPAQADLALRSATGRGSGDVAALADFGRAADLVPIQPEYHSRLAVGLVAGASTGSEEDAERDDALLDEAEREIRRALELFPNHVTYLHVWSDIEVARARMGDRAALDRALEHLERARLIDPYGWSTLDRLGAVTAATVVGSDDRAEATRAALAYYRRSVELNPDRIEPWRAIRTLAALVDDVSLVGRAQEEIERLTEG